MKRNILKISISIIVFTCCCNLTTAQDFELGKYRLIYKFSVVKQADDSRLLNVSFIARHKKNRKDRIPIYNTEIQFINPGIDNELVLGKAITDKYGNAQLIIPENHQYLTDNEGYINFEGRHNKTSFLPRKSAKLRLKDLDFSMELVEIDSVRTVLVNAFEKDSIGNEIPVDDLDIKIAVGSMFAKMTIEEATLQNGKYRYKFPEDLKGESDGNIVVYSIIEDHSDYGDLVQEEQAGWGVARPFELEKNNMLWTSAAPYWMYIVLTIMLVGVWANYAYTIYHLYRIKKEGQFLERLKTNNKQD